MAPQAGQLAPALASVGRAEEGGVLDAGVHRVRIIERGLEMPDALEDPGLLDAVVELVGHERFAGFRRVVVDEPVAFARRHAAGPGRNSAAGGVPGLASVIGALDHLTKPAARLRRVYAVGIRGRPLEVIDLPAGEVRAGDFPSLALPIRRQDERAFACTHEDPNSAHRCSLLTTGGRGSLTQVAVDESGLPWRRA